MDFNVSSTILTLVYDQILMGVPDRPELVLVKLREIKCKIGRRTSAKDRSNNIVSTKDVVRVVEGACKVRLTSDVLYV